MKKKIIFSLLLLSCFSSGYATEYSGIVSRFYINENKDVMVGINNSSLTSDCYNGGGMQIKFSADPSITPMSKEWISMFLSARVSGQPITVGITTPSISSRCVPSVVYL